MSAAARETAQIGLRRRKRFDVHIVAEYSFARTYIGEIGKGKWVPSKIERVDITFSVSAFSSFEIRSNIDIHRKAWETNKNVVVNGGSK